MTELVALLHRAQEAGFGEVLAAPVDVYLDEENGLQPDLLFIRAEHRSIISADDVRGAPDLVVEIVSPSTRVRDLGVKLRLYARFGVRVYWVVDPEVETITVFEAGDGGYEQHGTLGARTPWRVRFSRVWRPGWGRSSFIASDGSPWGGRSGSTA